MLVYIIAHHWLGDVDELHHVTLMPGAFDNRRDALEHADRLMEYEEELRPGAVERHKYEVCSHQLDDAFGIVLGPLDSAA